jgi:hypothetical protein
MNTVYQAVVSIYSDRFYSERFATEAEAIAYAESEMSKHADSTHYSIEVIGYEWNDATHCLNDVNDENGKIYIYERDHDGDETTNLDRDMGSFVIFSKKFENTF